MGDHLFAICEGDLPYAVCLTSNGDTETLGHHDFDEKLGMNMTAHPKKDPATDETFAFRNGPIPPFVTHFYFDASGEKQIDVHIAMAGRHPLFMHDFAITKKHTVSVDTQLNMCYTEMILRGDSLLHSDPTKASRIGVIPRCAKDSLQMRWFDVPGFNNIHAINEWDEEDGNVIILAPNILSIEHAFGKTELVPCLIEKVRIDLRTGIVSRHPISARNLDMGVINP